MEAHGRVRSEPVGVWSTGHSAWAPCEVRAGGGLEYRAPSLGPRSELGGRSEGGAPVRLRLTHRAVHRNQHDTVGRCSSN